ncbi:MAG: hybrid sensor histidine kinase/response regulator [Elusimicrobiaceae bacterium]|nr:hybrid sensor histidine kinase/response regulator [Elusimicrobiaceae bacterium]
MDGAAKILIVDDDDNLRDTLADLLAMEGYEVFQAASGAQAMELVASQFFHVILMDFNLSDKTGIEVIRDIRGLNTESQILMMTAHASLDTAVKAIQESVYDFLIKPVDFAYLKRIIQKALEKYYLEQNIKNLVAELKKKNGELTNLSDMKSKFLSMASHDLSNTLMMLQISFEMLVTSLTPNEEQAQKIAYITSGIEQISQLIGDLIDWASIEKGKFRLEKNYFEIEKLVENLIEGPRSRAAQKEVSVASDVRGSFMVCADRRRITQVLQNLLENAIRHTLRGGSIKVIVEAVEEGRVRVAVKDTGQGLDPEDAGKLFQSFYQSSSKGKKAGRLGLGLSIAKEIIESHNGRIWAESEGNGKGSVFQFVIPTAAPAAEEAVQTEGAARQGTVTGEAI